jgi:hypothetical protein
MKKSPKVRRFRLYNFFASKRKKSPIFCLILLGAPYVRKRQKYFIAHGEMREKKLYAHEDYAKSFQPYSPFTPIDKNVCLNSNKKLKIGWVGSSLDEMELSKKTISCYCSFNGYNGSNAMRFYSA